MIDIQLNNEWDLNLVNGDLVLLRGADEVCQHIKQRLLTFLGEWFLDLGIGLPWLQQILEKPADLQTVEAILQKAIRESPGVLELQAFEILADDLLERTARVNFTVLVSDADEPINIELEI